MLTEKCLHFFLHSKFINTIHHENFDFYDSLKNLANYANYLNLENMSGKYLGDFFRNYYSLFQKQLSPKTFSRDLYEIWIINFSNQNSIDRLLWEKIELFHQLVCWNLRKIHHGLLLLCIVQKGLFENNNKLNLLNANPTKWSNILKQFVGNLLTTCLSVFAHFVELVKRLARGAIHWE